jgi:hypothetical protein
MPTRILPFVTRADLLKIRDLRKWGRFLRHLSPYTNPDPTERVRLQDEQVVEAARDLEWSRRHGPIAGGAVVISFATSDPLCETIPADSPAAKRAWDAKYGAIIRRSRERSAASSEADSAEPPVSDISQKQLPGPGAEHVDDPG